MVSRCASGFGVILQLFFYQLFQLSFFSGQITVRIDTLWAQLIEFSTDHFETKHTCSNGL